MSTYLDAVYGLFVFAYEKNPKRSRFKTSELSNRAVSYDLDEDVMSLLQSLPDYDCHCTLGQELRDDRRFYKFGKRWGLTEHS